MISFLVGHLRSGVMYIRQHPNLMILLAVMVISPVLLWYTNDQYLQASLNNQERLQKERVGLMQDVMVSLLRATNFEPTVVQRELTAIAIVNQDIKEFRIAKSVGADVIPIAALNPSVIGEPEANPQYYRNALVSVSDSLIFPALENDGRHWYTYRAVQADSGEMYFIYTKLSLAAIDSAFAANNQKAYWSFAYLYLFLAGLAVWHVRMTDYRYLYRQAQTANEMKDLFTNMIAHELRAPLTAIRGYSSMIEEQTQGQDKEYAIRVRESAERLIAIVNDLLDVARIQSGKLKIENQPIDVSPIITKVLDELTISGQEKAINLMSEGSDATHLAAIDGKRLHQALTNLVSNAIKYTKEGSITVSIEEKHENIEIRVKDTGMGIESEDQKKLFAPFFRVATDDVSKITGTGLGMWITKQLIELMGGHIAVESIKGVGTHVVVTFKKVDN